MRVTVERLRLWILVAASLLIAVLVGFFLWSGFKYSHIVQNLPHRLGANIEQTASGFTYSQSSHGHTLFTIHASKLMSFKNDRAVLHDVSITLYGPAGSHREDKIYGAKFEYNRKTHVATSQGKVEIDLQSPAEKGHPGGGRNIHVQTSQLTFYSKSGLACTSQYTEFALPQGSGHAMGASYNSKTGLLVMEHKVYLKTRPRSTKSGPGATIHAAHLSFLRSSDEATLLSPVIHYRTETTTAQQALLYFRPNGSVSHVTAQNNVRIRSAGGAVLTAQLAKMQLNHKSQPQTADLSGGVHYASHAPRETMHGSARTAHLIFAQTGRHGGSLLRQAQMNQAVHFAQKITGAHGAVSTRDLRAAHADIAFMPAPGGAKSLARTITLEHNAVVVTRTLAAHQAPRQTTVRADKLVATLRNGRSLRTLDGTGHAEIASLDKNGATNTTHSDVVHLVFAPQVTKKREKNHAHHGARPPFAAARLVSAVEDGHVVMRQTPAKQSGKAEEPITAWARHAHYSAADQTVRLRGEPRLDQGTMLQLSAYTIDYHRNSGDAGATGDVKAIYRQPSGPAKSAAPQSVPQLGGRGATHVVAARAEFFQKTGEAIFHGSATRRARLWQGGNAVSAPVIALRRKPQQLHAYGRGEQAVSAAFTAAVGAKAHPSVVRVSGDSLTYSGKSHRGEFHGHVQAVDAFGTMRARNITMRITPAKNHQPARLDEMVATGGVRLTQPGRRAVGTRLVYTAKDERYVLTGRPGALPYLVDRVHGRTTGAALIFNNRNDSVEVSGGKGSAETETRVPK